MLRCNRNVNENRPREISPDRDREESAISGSGNRNSGWRWGSSPIQGQESAMLESGNRISQRVTREQHRLAHDPGSELASLRSGNRNWLARARGTGIGQL